MNIGDDDFIVAARDHLEYAKDELVCAVAAINNIGDDFESTVIEIKKTIGDLECAVAEIKNRGEQ